MAPLRSPLPRIRLTTAAALALLVGPSLASAQEAAKPRVVLSVGHYPRVDGVRINFRDRDFDLVRGANITVWGPYKGAEPGTVRGFAIGLPLTGVGELEGVGAGLFGSGAADDVRGLLFGGVGVGAGNEITGIAIGGIGAGAGGTVRGVALGGIGVGAGGDLRGIAAGGIGAGAGGSVRGLALGGIGVGAGGDARGFLAGGIGAAAAGDLRGLALGGVGAGVGGEARGLLAGGVGVGAGGDIRGIALGGVGVGAGGDVRGLMVGGVGVGAGGLLRGIAVGGIGVGAGDAIEGAAVSALAVGAPRIEGIAVGALARAREVRGIIIAPALFRSFRHAEVRGATLSVVNVTYGHQHGLALGLVNYAESLNGVQVGGINIVRDNPSGRRVLPVVNWGSGRR